MQSHYNQLGSGVKMAAYSHSQLLLLLLLLSVCLCGFGSVLGLKPASGPAEPPNPPVLRAADPPARDAPAAAAGASQPRRATGWKLSEEEACREDLTRLCPKHTWTNNLAVLECLQDHREVSGGRMGVTPRWSTSTAAVNMTLMQEWTSTPASASNSEQPHTLTEQTVSPVRL